MLDFLDSEGRLSSDKIPQARLSKTTRFADAFFQQEAQLSGTASDALPSRQHPFKLQVMPSRVSMLLVLTGVIISLQVRTLQNLALLLGTHSLKYKAHSEVFGLIMEAQHCSYLDLPVVCTLMQCPDVSHIAFLGIPTAAAASITYIVSACCAGCHPVWVCQAQARLDYCSALL